MLIPADREELELEVGGRTIRLTNLDKVFFPEPGWRKRDLLEYYAAVSEALLPHLVGRAIVMKRYPNGVEGDFFFMKRAPQPRPEWIEVCEVEHRSGNVIDFPMVDDRAALLWLINLGCIDINQWYSRCDDTDRPDYVHFDLDPVGEAPFKKVLEAALAVREGLDELEMPSVVKSSGSRGVHLYVPIERGPVQKAVWTFAKRFAQEMAKRRPKLLTAKYRIADRPRGTVLVDYNQNAWGRTLASVYSVRPRPEATVSTPVTWEEVEAGGLRIEDFRLDNVPARVAEKGDLFAPLLAEDGRVRLEERL